MKTNSTFADLVEESKKEFKVLMEARLHDEEDITAYEKLESFLYKFIAEHIVEQEDVDELVTVLLESGEFGGTGSKINIDYAWSVLLEAILCGDE